MVEREKELKSKTKSNIFQWLYICSRIVACCGYLALLPKVLICTTHIKQVIAKLYSFTPRSKIIRSEISLDTGSDMGI